MKNIYQLVSLTSHSMSSSLRVVSDFIDTIKCRNDKYLCSIFIVSRWQVCQQLPSIKSFRTANNASIMIMPCINAGNGHHLSRYQHHRFITDAKLVAFNIEMLPSPSDSRFTSLVWGFSMSVDLNRYGKSCRRLVMGDGVARGFGNQSARSDGNCCETA